MLTGMNHELQIRSPAPSDSILCAAMAPTTDRSQSSVTRHQRTDLTFKAPLQKPRAVDDQVYGTGAGPGLRHL